MPAPPAPGRKPRWRVKGFFYIGHTPSFSPWTPESGLPRKAGGAAVRGNVVQGRAVFGSADAT
jgi:hypothetical protein